MCKKINLLLVVVLWCVSASNAFAVTDSDADGVPEGVYSGTQVTAGTSLGCALDDDGAHCWGANFYNQTSPLPTLVNPVAITAGEHHACALDDTGVHCWGWNQYGQKTVPTLTTPVAVSAGRLHTCALDSTGVLCWGDNFYGETTVPTLTNPVAISAGDGSSCAIDDTGLKCWGNNNGGQRNVPALSSPTQVSAGGLHTCAIDSTGVHCWGYNYYGQTSVPALVNPVSVSAGGNHTCALDDSGVHCWGWNQYGQITVPELVNPVAVEAGTYHTCAIDDSGVKCWGLQDDGRSAGILFVADNCPLLANADQLDTDSDGAGDVCDADDDGDTVPDIDDEFPLDPDESVDTDSDGVGDNADACPQDDTESVDTDGDHLCDNSDPLPDDGNVLNGFESVVSKDQAGYAVAFAGDFDADGYGDYVIGMPLYDVPGDSVIKDAGRAVVISGKDGSELASLNGSLSKAGMGKVLAGGGDVNNDGYDDVVISAPGDSNPLSINDKSGSVTVLFGPDGAASDVLYAPALNIGWGAALAVGKLDGDNYADILVGAPLSEGEGGIADAGGVYVLDGFQYVQLGYFSGTTAKSGFGASVAAGDVNNNGSDDIIIGAPADAGTGSVTVYALNGTELMKKTSVVSKSQFSKSVASGDINNDGYDDVLVGATGDDDLANEQKDTGSVTVFSGADGAELTKHFGATAKANLGSSVAAGDVNNDGYADIIAGAWKDDKPGDPLIKDTGSVSIFSGSDYSLISTLYGAAAKDSYGFALGSGDINSDGYADIIVGAYTADVPTAEKPIKDAGTVSVVSGAGL